MLSVGVDGGLRKTGVVVINDKFEILSQNLIMVNSRGAERLVDIEAAFDSIIRQYAGEDMNVFVEGYAYGAKYQRESLAELGGVLRRYLFLANLPFWIVPPRSLKLFVTGTGTAKKNYMKKCTKDKWGEIFKSDDVCDAYGISRLGMCVLKAIRGKQGIAHLESNEQDVVREIFLHPEHYRNSNTAKKR